MPACRMLLPNITTKNIEQLKQLKTTATTKILSHFTIKIITDDAELYEELAIILRICMLGGRKFQNQSGDCI